MLSVASVVPAGAADTNSAEASSRDSPMLGTPLSNNVAKPKPKVVNSNGYHPSNTQVPLSSLASAPLDLTSVERRGQPTAVREPVKKRSRPHGICDAPTYRPTEEDWRDPLEYIRKIGPEASLSGICKIIPPDGWKPDFAIDTEKFHFRTRKQEMNSVEGSTRANLSYLDGLAKFHKQHGNSLHRQPFVDKKPLDLYRLKKAVESRGGFDKVCKLKKWAEIGRDLGYSGKIMSSLSTSLKNSFQRWLCPYEEYLRLAKPGVHQQLEYEYGGPLTPSPAVTPVKRSDVNTPSSAKDISPARQASDVLQANVGRVKSEADYDTPMADAPRASNLSTPGQQTPSQPASSGFTAINSGGFTAINAGFTSVNRRPANVENKGLTPDPRRLESTTSSPKEPAESRSSSFAAAMAMKRQLSCESSSDSTTKNTDERKEDCDGNSRRSKRLKTDAIPTVAGSHMTQFRPSLPRIPREEDGPGPEKCETCGGDEDIDSMVVCETCDHAYHGPCLDPPLKRKPDAEWNCPRCLVGDGHFGFEEGGLYSLKQFQQKANDFKQGYFEKKMPFDEALNCHRPVTEEDVENEFWRLVADLEETVEVEYGADIHCTTHGSGFPTVEKHPNNPYSTDPWNLNNLPLHPDSLFKHIKSDISGMTVPWVYVGMIFSTFCWHNEDHYAYSANYQHLGATKTWYGIPGEDAEKFENAMKEAVPELFETQPDLLFQLVTLLTPQQLQKAGVRVYAVDQRAGQLVITFPQAYHAGFNHGFNFNEAVNFAPSNWEPFGLAGVERLQQFRRQPCFSHDELLCTAAEGSASSGLTIQTAKWLSPALDRIHKREIAQREDFLAKHVEASPHRCQIFSGGEANCPMTFKVEEEDVQDEDEQCCSYCKAFAYLSRFKCHQSGKVLCICHAGQHPCCEQTETQRFLGEEHTLIYRKLDDAMAATYQRVTEKARTADVWEAKYDQLLAEEAVPSLKALRALLHEGERVPYRLSSLPILREFVERCNTWVEDATNYIVRKQQNRRKSEKAWHNTARKSIGNSYQEQKERESRNVDNIGRLLEEAERIGFDCPEILQLRERAEAIGDFQERAGQALERTSNASIETIEELLEEGRSFNVDTPEEDRLIRVLEQKRWIEGARDSRGVVLSAQDVQELVEEGKRLGIPIYNEHLVHFSQQMAAGLAWEAKAEELMAADFVHFPQLEALSKQVAVNSLPVSQTILAEVDQILHKQRDAQRQILQLTERCREAAFRKRPKYVEVVSVLKKLETYSKPNGTMDLENEKKRHEDWIRKGKRLFGKSNAPLHILNIHLSYIVARNRDCFDVDHDTPRLPGEPASRDNSPDMGEQKERWRQPNQDVFCICRKVEAGMMIECELCHEWYHYKCLKIARGKVKEDDKFTCPICDWRVKIPRDAARPKLEDLMALADEIPTLPFQPEEEELLVYAIDLAQNFRDRIGRLCNALLSTKAEVETQRFYLRKLEGAEILLSFETNFFRQELHKWCPVAPEAPPILEVSLSTRKPRPTKLQKMLQEYGVGNPDDLPEHPRGKANSLRRKAANAEAANAAAMAHSSTTAMQALFPRADQASGGASSHSSTTHGHPGGSCSPSADHGSQQNGGDLDGHLHPGLIGARGSQFLVDGSSMPLDESFMQGQQDGSNRHTEARKSDALETLSRTDTGRKQAENIWGTQVWAQSQRSMSDNDRSVTPTDMDDMMRRDEEGNVDHLFQEMTNEEDEEVQKRKDADADAPIDPRIMAESLESERNGLDALLDGE